MIYFISFSKLPDGDALAVRNINIARILLASGYDIKLIGMGMTEYLEQKEYKGLYYMSLRIGSGGLLIKLKNYFGFKKRLKKVLSEEDNIEAFVVNSLPVNALKYIKKISEQNNIKLLIDCCEWYSPEQFKWGKFDINYIKNMYFVQRYIDANSYPIAISKYLFDYFKDKGCKPLRIPAIMDIKNISYKKQTDPKELTLVYAGTPGKKDYLKEIIEGIALLEKNTIKKIELRIIGINSRQLIDMCAVPQKTVDKLGKSLNALGRIPREEVFSHLEEADFTVLLRSKTQRYAKAGFPTKVVESLASATPVICNITSDLGDYIRDGENGIIVEDCSAEAFSIAIKRALNIPYEQRKYMYDNARCSAEVFFDYRLYEETIRKLLLNN
jgi:glycosyltransferase involved in cell wall biosynthesis